MPSFVLHLAKYLAFCGSKFNTMQKRCRWNPSKNAGFIFGTSVAMVMGTKGVHMKRYTLDLAGYREYVEEKIDEAEGEVVGLPMKYGQFLNVQKAWLKALAAKAEGRND